jgi:hypothetical protein
LPRVKKGQQLCVTGKRKETYGISYLWLCGKSKRKMLDELKKRGYKYHSQFLSEHPRFADKKGKY